MATDTLFEVKTIHTIKLIKDIFYGIKYCFVNENCIFVLNYHFT